MGAVAYMMLGGECAAAIGGVGNSLVRMYSAYGTGFFSILLEGVLGLIWGGISGFFLF
jgi:hypothetical protein